MRGGKERTLNRNWKFCFYGFENLSTIINVPKDKIHEKNAIADFDPNNRNSMAKNAMATNLCTITGVVY